MTRNHLGRILVQRVFDEDVRGLAAVIHDLGCNLPKLFLASSHKAKVNTFSRKPFCNRPTNSCAGPRDEGCFVLKL